MELRHLRYFTAVADFGSFTAAARQLRVSQSSISEQILDLEKELEVPLLDRSGRTVQLTMQGRVFLEEARKTLDAAQRAVAADQAIAGWRRGDVVDRILSCGVRADFFRGLFGSIARGGPGSGCRCWRCMRMSSWPRSKTAGSMWG